MLRSALKEHIGKVFANLNGYNRPGSIANKFNNPLLITSWSGYPRHGGLCKFPNRNEGWRCTYYYIGKLINQNFQFKMLIDDPEKIIMACVILSQRTKRNITPDTRLGDLVIN